MIEVIKWFARENNVPIMMEDGLEFLVSYIRNNNIKSILEVGSAIGFSSIVMANISDDIEVDTIEIDEERFNIAVKNIKDFKLEARVHIYHLDAMNFKTTKKYDLIFIDAAKAQYKKYMNYFMDNLKNDGAFVFDNINFHGMVDNPSLTSNRNTKSLVRKIKTFRDEMLADEKFSVDFKKDIGDGVMIVKKSNKAFL